MKAEPITRWVAQAVVRGKMSQAELSRRLAVDLKRAYERAAVNKMVSGKRGVSAEEMLAIERITGLPVPSPHIPTLVPLIEWITAGKLSEPRSQIPVQDVPLLAFADLGRGEFFALSVAGDSMNRISPEGSVIIVDRSNRTPVVGKPFVFGVRGETTYKIWHADPPYLAPYSTNPANQPIFIKRPRDLEVIGRVRRTVLDL